MRKIAVTGGLASGKTSVCQILEKCGAYVMSADKIVHQLLSPNTVVGRQVIQLLGSDIVRGDQLDRSKIADKVFSHPDKLQALEKIVHPAVQQEIQKQYEKIKKDARFCCFVVEVPLLYESGTETFYDTVIGVYADPSICRERIASPQEYERRMQRQLSPQQKIAKAHVTITNNGDLSQLEEEIRNLIKELHLQ